MNQLKAHFSQKRLLNAVWGFVFSTILASTGHAQVGLKPVITNQPSDTIVLDNASATFRVGASSGTTLSYKWYFNSNLISGATANSYTRNPAQLSAGHAGFYHVEVINAAGSTLSRVARLTILVSNDIPVANNDTYTTQEDVPLTIPAAGILTNDVDVYPGTLTALLVSNASQGSLSLNTNGSFTYNPNPSYSGSDSFTYRTKDGGTTILEQNSSGGNKQEIKKDEPGAQSFRHGTVGDPSYSIKKVMLRLSKKAGQNNNLNFSIGTGINSGPIAGSSYTITMASISNATDGASFQDYDIVYNTAVGPLAAGTNYYLNLANSPNGKDVFVELASSSTYPRGTYYKSGADEGKDMRFEVHKETFSGIATVTLNVTPGYSPPTAVNDSTNTLEDVSVTVKVLANDLSPQGLPLTITDTSTTNGTAVVSGTNIVFRASTNYNGTVVFSYTISDGTTSSTASVTVNVAPVSDYPPVANDDTYSTAEDTTLIIPAAGVLANDSDGDGDAISALLVSNVANGSLSLNPNGSFTYTPNTNYNGTDSFTYRARDASSTGNVATVTINVAPINDPPIANNDTTNVMEDTWVAIKVLANDSDEESAPLTITGTSTTNGTAVVSGTEILFTPSTNYNGTAVFSYTISDGANSATANVTVTVPPENDLPLANDDSTNTLEDVSVTVKVLINDSDAEGPLTITTTSTTNGTVVISGTNVVFTPATNFNGVVVFDYTISDGTNSATASVTVTILPVNDPPLAINDRTNTLEDVSVTIHVLDNDSDVEGPLTIADASTTNGTAIISGTDVVFTPSTNYNGTAVFSYNISDGTNSATANVTVTVISVNDAPPLANDDTFTTLEDVPLIVPAAGVLANDTDVDGDPMTAVLVSNVSNGSLTFNANGSFAYTPNTNYNGSDSFTYGATDGMDTGNVATVTINVTPVNDAPRAANDSTNTLEDVSVTINVLANDSDVEGPLTITGTSTTNGIAVIGGTNVVFTPSTNYNGTVVFSYTISDGTNSDTANVMVTVISVNDVPIVNDDTTNTLEDVSVTVAVLANDSDVEGPLTITSAPTTNGTALISGSNIVFTPATNFNGVVVFDYTISDGTNSPTASVTVTVLPVNDAPRAVNDSTNTLEDVSVIVRVLANDGDVEGAPLTITGTSTTNGTAVISGPNVVFAPSTNYNGTAVFSYTISDGTNAATANVTVTVIPVNDPPIAVNDSTNTLEDVSVTVRVLANDSDVEGPLTITSTSTTNGMAVISGTNVVFMPATNFNGVVVFNYTISDGTNSATASVTVTVLPVNDPPRAVNNNTSTLEDVSVTINVLANDSDVERAPLTITGTSTTNGTAVVSGTNIVFTPSLNYNGMVRFSYTISDGTNSDTANVTVTVVPVNDLPIANNDSTNTLEDVSVTVRVLANDSDVEGPLTITSTSTTNGTAVISGTNVVFTPATNFNGVVLFDYTISDGTNAATASVTVTVLPVNDPPRPINDSTNTFEDVSVTIKVLANDSDVEGAALTITGTSTTNGTAVISSTNVVFTPSSNYNGTAVFSYTISDGTNSATANVTVTVIPVNDPPIAVNDSTNTTEDVSVTVKVLLNDREVEGTLLTITGTFTTNGTAVIGGTNVFFTPATNFNGVVVFSYTISDGTYSATGLVTVTVTATNDSPVAVDDTYTTLEDVPLVISAAAGILTNDFDVDGNALRAVLVGDVSNGTLTLNTNGGFTYTPATNYNGSDSFTYVPWDGQTWGNLATVTINLTAVNDPPIAVNNTATTGEDTSVSIKVLVNDIEPDGSALTITGTATTNGTAVVSGTNVVFTPSSNFNGTTVFTYTISDGVYSATGRVTVTVTSVNDAPVANNDSTNTLEDVSVTIRVLANDTDLEGAALSLSSTFTTNGTATISGTNIVFRPATNFNGTVAFSYVMTDGIRFATGSVTVAVAPVNDGPGAVSDTYTTQEDVPLNIPAAGVLTNDMDVEGDAFTALLVTNVTHGSLSLNPDGSFTYTPELDYFGSDSFTYRATDGLATGNVATVTINVTPINEPLRFVSQQMTTNGCKLVLSGPVLSTYVIFASTNLTDWAPISTNYTDIGNVVFTDTDAANHAMCFYRAMVLATNSVLEQNLDATGGTTAQVLLGTKGAQSFRHGTIGGPTYVISKVVLHLSRSVTGPQTNLNFNIGTGINAGTITGSSVSIPPSSITNTTSGASFQTYDVVFATPVGPLTAGTAYYLNMDCEASNGRRIYLQYGQNNAYASGTYYEAGLDDLNDIWFQVWGR